MMRIRKRASLSAILLVMATVTLSGCGNIKSNSGKNSIRDGEDYTADIPSLDQFDAGMSKAHFISVPSSNSDSKTFDANNANKDVNTETDAILANGMAADIYNYKVSYNLEVQNTSAYVVLGSAEGEYGELILCELKDNENADFDGDGNIDGASFLLKRFSNGISDNRFENNEIAFESDEAHNYEVHLTISGKELTASVNGAELGTWEIPAISLGCVGTYKYRGTTVAYLDDFIVETDDSGEVLFADDFDGNFVNKLYEYDYYDEATSAFSPYHIRTTQRGDSNRLVVSSGFILSETKAHAAPRFRREFECKTKELKGAYLYMTALGSFDAYINGEKVSDDFFAPGKMVYDQNLEYVSYDVTRFISDKNALDIDLFHGFFDRGSGYPESTVRWARGNGIKGELVLVYQNGDTQIIPTGDSFVVKTDTRYRFNDIYNGEIIDDRYGYEDNVKKSELQSEHTSDQDTQWQNVAVDDVSEAFLHATISPKTNEPIAAVETRDCVSVDEPIEGHFVYDFGQNFAGTISFNLSDFSEDELKDGQVIMFRFGELLNSDDMVNTDGETGTVWTENLYTARATDYYVCGKNKSDSTEITFAHTYHGFRYVEITGLDKKIEPENIKALVLSTKMKETGDFVCSSDIINRFYTNSKYSMKSNLMDVPTDCAQRDERLGWSGDAQTTSLFTMYQFEAKKFFESYLEKLRLSQMEDGAFPDVVPFGSQFGGNNCWGDAAVLITWNLYLQYGDRAVIEDNYEAMCRWVDYLVATSDDFLRTSHGYGDHLSGQETDETLSDTAYCAHSARLVSKMAAILGKNDDASKYSDYADEFTAAWQKSFIREDGAVDVGILFSEYESETAYSLGIMFDLFPDDLKEGAKERLKLLADFSGYGFYPGYAGMTNFLPALAAGGNAETVVKVLTNTAPGGIAYPLSMGLTTNPEELGAFRFNDEYGNAFEDGKYKVSGSLNHAAYSSVCSFLFSDILGIKPDEDKPGYEHFYISPAYTSGLEYAQGSYESVRGPISVKWNVTEKYVEGEVPDGTTCTLTLANGEVIELEAGAFHKTW